MPQDPNLPAGVTNQMISEAGDPGILTCIECGRTGEAEDFTQCPKCGQDHCYDCKICFACGIGLPEESEE